jgi:hypothetical protein
MPNWLTVKAKTPFKTRQLTHKMPPVHVLVATS